LRFAVVQSDTAVHGAFLTKPIMLIPLPWYDMTTLTEKVPARDAFGIVIDLGLVLTGMIIPFFKPLSDPESASSSRW